jgi:Zn-dependent protease with chaperone function
MKKHFKYFLLFIIMAYTSQWMVINLYLTSIGQKQQVLTKITESPLIDLIYQKTGVKLDSFQIVASPKMYATMIGIPGHPYMMLSSSLDSKFTDSEKEYVVLHEVGHYVLHHTIKEGLFFLILLLIGIIILRKRTIFLTPVIGIVFGLLFIQFATRSEYESDHYAVSRITDPNGMITSTAKFKNDHYLVLNDYGIKWKLLYRSTPYHVRIQIVENEIAKRSK